MVKNKLTLILIFFSFYLANSQDNDLWFYKTPENTIYEKCYESIFSNLNDGVLKEEIKKYIKFYIDNSDKKNQEVAIIVGLISISSDTRKYSISYSSDYYSDVVMMNKTHFQSVTKINDRIVFLESRFNNDFVINKHFLYGLLRARFPKVTQELNEQYQEVNKNGGVPVIFATEHQIPYWYIAIKDSKLVSKEIVMD